MIGKKLKRKGIFLFLAIAGMLFLMEGSVIAKAPQFRLDMDSLNLEKGVSANLVFSLTNARGAEITDIQGLDHFDVISRSTSSSTKIINGDTTYQVNYTYVIMPKDTGEFTLKGSVEYNGQTHETNELQVNVKEANMDMKGEVKDLFVKTNLSTNEIYFGQKVVLSYELYARYNIENFGFVDNTDMKDFIGKDTPEDNLKANYTYIDGNKYVKYEAKQTILSPIKTGTFTIPSYNFQVNVSTGDFFSSSKAMYLQTEAKELRVKSLPEAGKPADFTGIVGNLKLDAHYNKVEVNYGDSLTLQVTASGDCNLDNIDKIIKDNIPGFTVYQTQKNAEEGIADNQYNAKKEFEVILVPEKTGDLTIEPIHISYFNPKSESYEQAEIPGVTITVNGEISQLQTGGINGTTQMETIKIDQVSYKPEDQGYLTIRFKKTYLLIGVLVLIGLLIITAICFLLLLYRKRRDKRLYEIYRQIKASNSQNEIYNLFSNMIKHCFNLSLKASSRKEVTNRLGEHKIATPVLEIMNYMEYEKYHENKGSKYLKDKIKEVYQVLIKIQSSSS